MYLLWPSRTTYVGMAYIVMAYTVMAYIVIAHGVDVLALAKPHELEVGISL